MQSIIVYNGAHYMTYDLKTGICHNNDDNDRFNMDQIFKNNQIQLLVVILK